MTGRAQRRLVLRLELCLPGLEVVDAVARAARELAHVVRAPLPRGVRTAVVAGHALCTGFAGRHLRGIEDQLWIATRVHVRLPGAMAGFTTVLRARRARIAGD